MTAFLALPIERRKAGLVVTTAETAAATDPIRPKGQKTPVMPPRSIFAQNTAKGSRDRASLTNPIWTITMPQEGPIPVTRLTGEIVWINAAGTDKPDDAVYPPEDEQRIEEVAQIGRPELRSEIETVFSSPTWPPASAIVEPFRRYSTKVLDVNAAAYRKMASKQAKDSHEVLNAMVSNLLNDVCGSEWESSPGEKVTRTDWQFGIEGWKGKEMVVIAGNDPDKNCLYHQVVGDAITYRYRFHDIPPAPEPGEPPGINLQNREWWQYIGLNERHNLAMAIKPYLEDRTEHWQFVYPANSLPTTVNTGAESVLPTPNRPLEPSAPENSPKGNHPSPPRKKRGRPAEIPGRAQAKCARRSRK